MFFEPRLAPVFGDGLRRPIFGQTVAPAVASSAGSARAARGVELLGDTVSDGGCSGSCSRLGYCRRHGPPGGVGA